MNKRLCQPAASYEPFLRVKSSKVEAVKHGNQGRSVNALRYQLQLSVPAQHTTPHL